MAVCVNDIYQYVGLEAEYLDNVQIARANRVLKAAEMWLRGAVGYDVDLNDERAEELVLMAAGEMFETRNLTDDRLSKYSGGKALASLNRYAGDVIMQLKCELAAQENKHLEERGDRFECCRPYHCSGDRRCEP